MKQSKIPGKSDVQASESNQKSGSALAEAIGAVQGKNEEQNAPNGLFMVTVQLLFQLVQKLLG